MCCWVKWHKCTSLWIYVSLYQNTKCWLVNNVWLNNSARVLIMLPSRLAEEQAIKEPKGRIKNPIHGIINSQSFLWEQIVKLVNQRVTARISTQYRNPILHMTYSGNFPQEEITHFSFLLPENVFHDRTMGYTVADWIWNANGNDNGYVSYWTSTHCKSATAFAAEFDINSYTFNAIFCSATHLLEKC